MNVVYRFNVATIMWFALTLSKAAQGYELPSDLTGDPANPAGASAEAAHSQQAPENSPVHAQFVAGRYNQALAELAARLKSEDVGPDSEQRAKWEASYGYLLYLQQRGKSADPKILVHLLSPAREHLQSAASIASRLKNESLQDWVALVSAMIDADCGLASPAREAFERILIRSVKRGDPDLASQAELQMARIESDPTRRYGLLDSALGRVLHNPSPERSSLLIMNNGLNQISSMLNQGTIPAKLTAKLDDLGQTTALRLAEQGRKTGGLREQALAEEFFARDAVRRSDPMAAVAHYDRAISHAVTARAFDLAIPLETSLARLLTDQDDHDRAIKTYRQAIFHIDQIRNDIPILQNGISTYESILEPVYRGLADLLLLKAQKITDEKAKQLPLTEAIKSIEQMRRSELEDYFNDRCALDSDDAATQRTKAQDLSAPLPYSPLLMTGKLKAIDDAISRAAGSRAVIYPIVEKDRLELLLFHDGVIYQRTVAVSRDELTREAIKFAVILRHGKDYRSKSKLFFNWVVAPILEDLKQGKISRVDYLPDTLLRLVPLAVLSPDGKDFFARHYITVTNSSFQNAAASDTHTSDISNALLAGVSRPSEKLLSDKDLPAGVLASLAGSPNQERPAQTGERSTSEKNAHLTSAMEDPELRSRMIKQLELENVHTEIGNLQKKLLAKEPLINETVTKERLTQELHSGQNQIAHISTHSYFGHSASDSFIVAYDEVLTVNEVEDLLRPAHDNQKPIELVTFSACSTAQGDDRAPLGFSGLALRAHARNAIGALWPIRDDATRQFMEEFYSVLKQNGGDKAEALQQAQLKLMAEPTLGHPSLWGPFILVGQW